MGEIRGHTGWFPESYVECIDKTETPPCTETNVNTFTEELETKHLEYEQLKLSLSY